MSNNHLEELMKELNSLIGLKSVKESIQEIIALQKVTQEKKRVGLKVKEQTLHMLFTGNPGTGKTTVARLVGKIFHALGILKKGGFKEVNRNHLVSEFLGQTSEKATKVIESALDGVLFIDEAYALSRNSGSQDYGVEAIDTLVPLMENYRDRLIVILAGYSKEMEQFMESNSGLNSRIAYKIEFPDYTAEELFQIFVKETREFIYSKKVESKIREYLNALYENRSKNFGNGRDVRNFLEEMERRQARRLAQRNGLTKTELMTFLIEDVPPLKVPFSKNDQRSELLLDAYEPNEHPQGMSSDSPTVDKPLLLGILVDVSGSMFKAIRNRDDVVQNRFDGFRSSLRKVLDKAKETCKDDNSGKIITLVKVFTIGFGFGNPFSVLMLGDTDKTRDLFELPNSDRKIVPINDLIDNWKVYEDHVEKLIRKMGGETPMGEAFKLVEGRLLYEMQMNAYHPNPVIFVISDGVPTGLNSLQNVKEIAKRIKEMGTIIISCYITDKNIVKAKYLFNRPDRTWDEGAKLMFECASIPPKDSVFYRYFHELGWETNNNSGKLFSQINESEFLEDFMESIISPLKIQLNKVKS